jgi:two-component system sensor histidine kinase BarA
MLERKKHPYKSVSDQQDLIALLPNYPHLVIGIKSTDIKTQLIDKLLPLITDKHKTVTFALPSHHPLPVLPNIINVINKPIRPEFIIPKDTIIQDPQSVSHQTTLTNPEIRVVVAEDNYFNQILIANILEMNNIKSYIASNGREALELIAQQQPDLAIIDIHMPVMDGFEATKIIRKNGDLPIISLTANIIVQDHQKIIAAGSNCIVLKPINADELIRHIRDLTKASVTKQQNQPLLFTSESDTFSQAATVVQYEVDKSVLNDELARLLARLESAFVGNDISKMHSVAHQLIGIAGLYELPAVELTTIELQTKLKAADIRDSWVCLARLKRIINHPEDA